MGFAEITELWNYGIMELRKGQVGSLLIAQSHSLLSLPSIPFRLLSLVFRQRSVGETGQQVYKTTKQLQQPVGFAGITDLWNYGKGKSVQSSWLIAQSHSLLSLPSIPFRLLSLVFRQRSVGEAGQQVYKTTKQLRQPVGFAGITDLWNHGGFAMLLGEK